MHKTVNSAAITGRVDHFFSLSGTRKLELLLGVFLGSAPLFLVTLRDWASGILIFGSIFCLISLRWIPSVIAVGQGHGRGRSSFVWVLFVAPVTAVLISSVANNFFTAPQFDAPVRFLVAIPIFLFTARTQINPSKVLSITAPLALLITLVQQYTVPQPELWGAARMATYFADPLVFGYTALTLSMVCCFSLLFMEENSPAKKALMATGTLVGIYLSIRSGSRTGWIAIPLLAAYFGLRNGKAYSAKQRASFALGLLAICLLVYLLSGTVQSRLATAWHEIATYGMHGVAEETSVGLRITLLRMAWDLFLQRPLFGYGDMGIGPDMFPAGIHAYASAYALQLANESGFHNEMVTNAIRSGTPGLISAAALFFVPLYLFDKCLKHSVDSTKTHNARLGMVLVTCFLASSFSTETFDLKYMASFYAVILALLLGSIRPDHE